MKGWDPVFKTIRETLLVAKYDIILYFRYPANILWIFAAPIVFSCLGILLVKLIGIEEFNTIIGGDTSGLTYVLCGYSMFSISNFCWQSNSKIEKEVTLGTSKTNFMLPINKISYLYGLSISTIITTGIISILFILAIIFFNGLPIMRILLVGLLFILSIIAFLGISLIVSSISLAFRQLGSLTNIITFALQMVTGLIIPLRVFPISIQNILKRSPTSLSIDSIRSVALNLEPMDPLWIQILLLLAYGFILNLLGYLLCQKSLKSIKEKGLINSY